MFNNVHFLKKKYIRISKIGKTHFNDTLIYKSKSLCVAIRKMEIHYNNIFIIVGVVRLSRCTK